MNAIPEERTEPKVGRAGFARYSVEQLRLLMRSAVQAAGEIRWYREVKRFALMKISSGRGAFCYVPLLAKGDFE